MLVRLHLTDETERILRERAAQGGQTLEAFLEGLADREATVRSAPLAGADADDFERGLDALSGGLRSLPTLPANFGRADVYDEHA